MSKQRIDTVLISPETLTSCSLVGRALVCKPAGPGMNPVMSLSESGGTHTDEQYSLYCTEIHYQESELYWYW